VKSDVRKNLIFFIPTFSFLALFVIYPIIYTFILSFESENVYTSNNYYKVLSESNPLLMLIAKNIGPSPPWGALLHNIVWVLIHAPVTIILSLVIAYIIKYYNIKGSSLIKALLFLGMVIPPVIAGFIIRFMFDENIGIIPKIMKLLSLDIILGIPELSKTWMNYPSLALFSLILGSIWLWLGFSITIISAGMEAIPKSHIEIAKVFGASPFKILFKVIVPELKPVILTVFILTILWDLKLFDIVYASTGGGPGGSSTVLALIMYQYFIHASRYGGYGMSATVAVILTLITLFPALIYIYRSLKRS